MLPVREAGGKLRSRAELLTMMGVGVGEQKRKFQGGTYRKTEITRQQGPELLHKEREKADWRPDAS